MPNEELHFSRKSLKIPAQVTCLACGETDRLLAGSGRAVTPSYHVPNLRIDRRWLRSNIRPHDHEGCESYQGISPRVLGCLEVTN